MLEQTIGRWFDEATLKGVNLGRQEGWQELFTLQVQQRFGGLPDWVKDRLQNAKKEELLGWSNRLLTAQSVQELFNDQAANDSDNPSDKH